MTQQTINVGSAINDGTGDPARTAFTKSNNNFTEVYGADFVDNTRLANMVQATVKGRPAGAGTGDPTDLTAAQVGTILASAWTTYTPTITADAGAFTTVSATGKYITFGKLTHIIVRIDITAAGTAAGAIAATLPNTSNSIAVLAGRESGNTGKMLQGVVLTAGTIVSISFYDGSGPIGNGCIAIVSGIYENT